MTSRPDLIKAGVAIVGGSRSSLGHAKGEIARWSSLSLREGV